MKKKNGFTLIELLAVIIILGILMIIAIPSVTKYINDSRKNTYIDTAKELVGGARNVVNEGKLEMYSTNTTYYIPSKCIKTENGGEAESPYGKFKQAYIGVIYNGQGYKYYWISVDESGQGIKDITPLDKLDVDLIESDLKASDVEDIVNNTGIGNRSEIKILDCSTNSWDKQYQLDNTNNNVSEDVGGEPGSNIPSNIVCIPATNLHKKECTATSNGCYAAGYTGDNHTITYGTIKNGNPKAGDAYDCKVTKNGGYSERFYYVTNEGENSILIYYKNMNNNSLYAYDINNTHINGPRTGYEQLPSTSDWDNPGLIQPGTRQIVGEFNNENVSGGQINLFTYTNKAARLLTTQEIVSACPSLPSASNDTSGELDGCIYFLENLGYFDGSSELVGYWLETPKSSLNAYVFAVNSIYRKLRPNFAGTTNSHGIRPVITIKTNDLG